MKLISLVCTLLLVTKQCHAAMGKHLASFFGHRGDVTDLNIRNGSLYSCAFDGTVREWNLTTGATIRIIPAISSRYIIFRDGSFIVTARSENISEYRTDTGRLLRSFGSTTRSQVFGVAIYQERLYSCRSDSLIDVFSLATGVLIRSYALNATNGFYECALVRDEIWFSDLLTLRILNLTSGLTRLKWTAKELSSSYMTFSVLEKTILIRITTALAVTETHEYTFDGVWLRKFFGVRPIYFKGPPELLITGTETGQVIVYDYVSGSELQRWQAHQDVIRSMILHNGILVTGSYDNNIHSWEFLPGTPLDSKISIPPLFVHTEESHPSHLPSTLPMANIAPPSNSQQDLSLWIIIASISALFLIVGLATICIRYSRIHGSKIHGTSTASLIGQTHISLPKLSTGLDTETIDRTLLVSAHELSIPGFLYTQNNIDFRIGTLVAKGGCSMINECRVLNADLRARTRGENMVCKVISEAPLREVSERTKDAFFQELSLLWRFRDFPYFAKVYGFAEEPLCLLMKWYAGDLLAFLTGKKSFPVVYNKSLIVTTYRAILQAVAYMHNFGIAHCYIKPANVLLDISVKNGSTSLNPFLTDFGISIAFDKDQAVEGYKFSEVRGLSPSYSAPEAFVRYRTRPARIYPIILKAGDIYSLAATLKEMLCRTSNWA